MAIIDKVSSLQEEEEWKKKKSRVTVDLDINEVLGPTCSQYIQGRGRYGVCSARYSVVYYQEENELNRREQKREEQWVCDYLTWHLGTDLMQ